MSLSSVRRVAFVLFITVCVVPHACFAAAARQQTPAELLQVAKNSHDPEVKQAAIKRLGDISETDERSMSVTETLMDIIKTSVDPFVGKECVRTLTQLEINVSRRPKTKYVKPFVTLLVDPRAIPGVRSEVATCFMKTLDKDDLPDREAFKAVQDIAKSKTEPNVALRGKCVEAMGSFGNPDSITVLCDLLSDPDGYIKEAAAKAVSTLLDLDVTSAANVSQGAANKIVEMVNDDKLNVDLRVIVIRADAQMMAAGTPGANRGFDKIVFLVANSQDDKVVLASIEALGIIGTAQAADPLIKTYSDYFSKANPTNDKDVPIRRAVVKALRSVLTTQGLRVTSDLQTVHKVTLLLNDVLANDPVAGVKESAVYALGYLYPKKFEAEYKDSVTALVFLMDVKDTDANTKTLISDVLEAITHVNYGVDVTRWKEWMTLKYK